MTLTGCTKFGTFILGLFQHCYTMFNCLLLVHIYFMDKIHIHIHMALTG